MTKETHSEMHRRIHLGNDATWKTARGIVAGVMPRLYSIDIETPEAYAKIIHSRYISKGSKSHALAVVDIKPLIEAWLAVQLPTKEAFLDTIACYLSLKP